MKDLQCAFGSGKQVTSECRMIYVHWSGYYPGEKNYLKALATLCPNMTPELKKHIKKKIIAIRTGHLPRQLADTANQRRKNAGR